MKINRTRSSIAPFFERKETGGPAFHVRKLTGCAVILVVLTLIMVTGCSFFHETQTPELKYLDGPTTITLTPVELFKGDEAKYKMFLGGMTGAFKLRYEGPKPNASLHTVIWEDGKSSESSSVGDLFLSSREQENREIEVIISIETLSSKENQDEREQVKVEIVQDSGSSLSTFTVPHDKKLTGRGLMANQIKRTFAADQPVPVWGMQATSKNFMQTADLTEESIRGLEWGLVFTLRFED